MRYVERLKVSEVTIQAELFSRCKENNFECALEYTYENCRFDAVIVVDKDIVAIVEVKSLSDIAVLKERKFTTKKIASSDQLKKYTAYGVPVLLCLSRRDIGRTVYKIGKLVEEHPFTKKQKEIKIQLVNQVDQLVQDFKSYFPNALSEKDDLEIYRGTVVEYIAKASLDAIENVMAIVFEQLPSNPNRPELLFYKRMNAQIRGVKIADASKIDSFRTYTGQYVSQSQCQQSGQRTTIQDVVDELQRS